MSPVALKFLKITQATLGQHVLEGGAVLVPPVSFPCRSYVPSLGLDDGLGNRLPQLRFQVVQDGVHGKGSKYSHSPASGQIGDGALVEVPSAALYFQRDAANRTALIVDLAGF